jgi:hypothetical protein
MASAGAAAFVLSGLIPRGPVVELATASIAPALVWFVATQIALHLMGREIDRLEMRHGG